MRPMAPGDVADIRYWVGEVREHSFEFRCEASATNGDLVFAGRCAVICIHLENKRKLTIPDELREMLMRYTKQGEK
jgi:acyl-CoA thioesterase FadM